MTRANRLGAMMAGLLAAWTAVGATGACAQDTSRSAFQDPNANSAAPLKRGANSFAESQARALVEAQGYSNVSALMNGSDGIWRGTATKESRSVSVSIDFKGHVVAQ